MKKVVIAGSAKLQKEVDKWLKLGWIKLCEEKNSNELNF